VSVPAPATAELLRGIPLASCEIASELTTPTGAALVATLVDHFGPLPPLTLETIGYGAGTRDLAERPNILRLLVGEMAASGDDSGWEQDQVWILETNLDDAPGEWIGYCLTRLLEAGALDVYTTPIHMKKNRPGTKLSALCRPGDELVLQQIMFAETGSLGIRRALAQRQTLRRQTGAVATPWGIVQGKIALLSDGQRWFAPEYESCRQLAAATGQSLRELYRAAQVAFAQSPRDMP
jgi:uncharacterized protein (DUF111 family)